MDEALTAPKRETIKTWDHVAAWHWFKGIFVGRLRKETAREAKLRFTLAEIGAALESANMEVKRLKNDILERDSTIKLQELEIRNLAAINERNFRRVEAETAMAAGQEGIMRGPKRD